MLLRFLRFAGLSLALLSTAGAAAAQCVAGCVVSTQASPTLDHAAILAGNAFSVSTGLQSVASGNYLNARLLNTSPTATCTIILRRFTNSGSAPLSYLSGNDVAALASPTSVTTGNRYVGGSGGVAPIQFTFNTSATATVPSTSPSDVIPATGSDSVTVEKLIAPGHSIGFTIGGAGGMLLTQAATTGVTVAGYCGS